MLNKDQLNGLFRYAVALAQDETGAFDLVQSAVEKVLKKRLDAPISYFKVVIRNLFFDELRREKRFPHEDLQDDLRESLPLSLSIQGLEAIYINKDLVENILAQLSPGDREILYLFAVEEMTFEEISKLTGKKKGTLLSRMHRMREKFKNHPEVKRDIIS